MLFRLAPLSVHGPFILTGVIFLCGWVKTPCGAWSGMCRGLFPLESLELLAWSLLVASWQELGWLWAAESCPEDGP